MQAVKPSRVLGSSFSDGAFSGGGVSLSREWMVEAVKLLADSGLAVKPGGWVSEPWVVKPKAPDVAVGVVL